MRIRDEEELQELISSLKRDSHKLMHQMHEIMWHMRGSISREAAWSLTYEERKDILSQIEERVKLVETTKLALI